MQKKLHCYKSSLLALIFFTILKAIFVFAILSGMSAEAVQGFLQISQPLFTKVEMYNVLYILITSIGRQRVTHDNSLLQRQSL